MAFYHIDKISNITGNVKTQKIALKQASNNFTSPGHDVENIGGGKRCMVKASALYIRPRRPQETRYPPSSVFVDPHKSAPVSLFCHPFSNPNRNTVGAGQYVSISYE